MAGTAFVSHLVLGRAGRTGHRLGRQCPCNHRERREGVVVSLFGFGKRDEAKEAEIEEAMRQQQEVLNRRNNKQKGNDYFENVHKRREQLEENYQHRVIKKKDGVDPIEQWKELQAEGVIKDIGYEDVPDGGIQMPMASFGIPQYDNGERFDLRLPYVDSGYEDEGADFMGKIASWFSRDSKKKDKTLEDEDEEMA